MAIEKPAVIMGATKLQPASLDIWQRKYQLKTNGEVPVDKNLDETYIRVARALANIEEEPIREEWYKNFVWALQQGAIPAGRIMANAGSQEYKPATSLINCTVSGTVQDSIESILAMHTEAGLTLAAGCGIGYEFSTLRPKGAYVNGAGAATSGPLPFMDIYNTMCSTIASAGGRRGAQMATFDISHPDVMDFIKAKKEDGRFRQFNLSLLITSEFMEAVSKDADWKLYFPITKKEFSGLIDAEEIVWRELGLHQCNDYEVDEAGKTACRVYKTIKARMVWNAIMTSTYDYAEPGFILIDRVNDENNNWWCEDIRATNPCGEQPLPPHGGCLLGSINLTKFVVDPFTPTAHFDFEKFCAVAEIFTRMLDNVVEINGLPLPEQRTELFRKRRHGMGFLGLGSACAMLGMKYGEAESVQFTTDVARRLAVVGWQQGLSLAREKGPAPIFNEEFVVTDKMLRQRPEMKQDGWQQGSMILGKNLFKYSVYMKRIKDVEPATYEAIVNEGCRFTHHTSIAPTGTISLSLANNASNGIEPSFDQSYSRNIIKEGKKTKESVRVYSAELLAYRSYLGLSEEQPNPELPASFIDKDDVTPQQHVDIQAAAQYWIDSSISKTANVPQDYPYEEFKGIYQYAYEKGLKGCTTFRYNPEVFQGVLVKDEDLEGTIYRFTLEDGSPLEVRGNEEIEYDGEIHTAANLFDALKEGLYGKF